MKRILWTAVVSLAASAALTAGALWLDPGMRGTLFDRMLSVLRWWDAVHADLDPHVFLTREAQPKDLRPLAEQARAMEKDLDESFTAEGGRLFLIGTPPVPLGDVCLWQGVFAAEAGLRWSLRRTPANMERARRALEGLELLMSRGRPIARAVYPAGLETEPPGIRYGRDRRWQWKEDASVDSAAGWVFGAAMLRETVPPLRKKADALLIKYCRNLREAGYRLRNSDGTLTRFNRAGGAFINSPGGMLSTLAALRAAAHADPSGPWESDHGRFVRQGQDRWGAYGSGPLLWDNKTTNHNIAFLALSAALLTEYAPERRAVYGRGLARLARLTRKMGDSFWLYLAHWTLSRSGMGDSLEDKSVAEFMAEAEADYRLASVAMREWDYPACKVVKETLNSRRSDLKTRLWPLWGPRTLSQPLPLWQRPPADFVWQRSAYSLDDWRGYGRDPPQRFSPLDFLVAYRLGLALGAPLPEGRTGTAP